MKSKINLNFGDNNSTNSISKWRGNVDFDECLVGFDAEKLWRAIAVFQQGKQLFSKVFWKDV